MGNQLYSKRLQFSNNNDRCMVITKKKKGKKWREHPTRGIKVNHPTLAHVKGVKSSWNEWERLPIYVKLSDSNFNVIPNIFSLLMHIHEGKQNLDIEIDILTCFRVQPF